MSPSFSSSCCSGKPGSSSKRPQGVGAADLRNGAGGGGGGVGGCAGEGGGWKVG